MTWRDKLLPLSVVFAGAPLVLMLWEHHMLYRILNEVQRAGPTKDLAKRIDGLRGSLTGGAVQATPEDAKRKINTALKLLASDLREQSYEDEVAMTRHMFYSGVGVLIIQLFIALAPFARSKKAKEATYVPGGAPSN